MAATEIELYKSDDSVIIDIPIDLEFGHGVEPCIHRVPRKLRKVNEAAYTPQFVSIGPFHHGRTEFLGMERHKRRYFNEFCKRTGKGEADLKSFINDDYEDIVRHYAGNIGFKKEYFLDMVMFDACFIIELFLRNSENFEGDYILKTPWLQQAIGHDLILLENQLPYAFLRQLYNKFPVTNRQQHSEATGNSRTENERNPETVPLLSSQHCNISETIDPFLKHSCQFFSTITYCKESEVAGIKHFTDLVRQVLCPKKRLKKKCSSCEDMTNLIYSAKKLDSAGVSLVPLQKCPLAELDIASLKFIPCIPCLESTELKLPEFEVQDGTELLLRNVMALEQCLYTDDAYICQFIFFLDRLIDNTEDVDLLVEKKIVTNRLGSNDVVAELINKLTDEITVSEWCYHEESERLNAHCEDPCNRIKAKIKREYFKDWWTGSTAIFGLLVLLFSFFATIKALFFS